MTIRCRGEESRITLVRDYQLKPIAHVKLLNGQTKKSCTNDLLTDSYYCFTYKNKSNNTNGSFYCGSHAANHFLKLLGRPSLPLFNPLTSLNSTENSGNSSNATVNRWNPAAKELHNAINLFIICWNSEIRDFVGEIKAHLENNPNQEPHISKIKTINTIISFDKKHRTLQQMISDLRLLNPSIRSFRFTNLNKVLKNNNLVSHFE